MARLKMDYELQRYGSEKVFNCPYRQRAKADGCYHTIYRAYRHIDKATYLKTIYKCQLTKPHLITFINIKKVDRPFLRGLKQLDNWVGVQKWEK
jgi:hypothetical protein